MHEIPEDDRFLRPDEAAAALKVSDRVLQRLEAEGRLRVIRTFGGHRRYREPDVRALQKEQEALQDALTAAQVAALFHVSIKSVWRWANEGRLTFARGTGRQFLFPAAQFEDMPRHRQEGGRV